MSSFSIKSKVIANRDASPSVLSDAIVSKGVLMEAVGCERIPTTADAGSTVKLLTIPSSARLSSLEYFNAGIGTSALDVAAWYPTSVAAQSGIVAATLISSSVFVANIQGVDTGTIADAMGTVAQQSVVRRTQPLWQSLGLASDPMIDIDLGFTVRTANSVAGYVGLRARYVR